MDMYYFFHIVQVSAEVVESLPLAFVSCSPASVSYSPASVSYSLASG